MSLYTLELRTRYIFIAFNEMTLNKKSERETESRGGCQNVLLKKKKGISLWFKEMYANAHCSPEKMPKQ